MLSSRDVTFVVQGNIRGEIRECMASIRRFFPQSPIVLSTWAGSDISGVDCNEAVFSIDPGGLGDVYLPGNSNKEHHPNNINRQIVSSHKGLSIVKTPYAVKTRPDLVFTGTGILNIYNQYERKNYKIDSKWRLFKKRVLMLYPNNCQWQPLAYYMNDLVLLGCTEDLQEMWNIPLQSYEDANYCLIKGMKTSPRFYAYRYAHAQHIMFANMDKKRIEYYKPAIFWELSEKIEEEAARTFVNNFYFVSYADATLTSKFNWLTNINNKERQRYTEDDWMEWYKEYVCNERKREKSSAKYAIITPTYIKHFKYIEPYLRSFQKYVIDSKEIKIYFIISRAESASFKKIIAPYKDLNIIILFFEEVLSCFGIQETPEKLLEKYGRFTFQTLKKLYGVLYISEERSLVLDCESMWVTRTRMKDVFQDFFSQPRIYGSRLKDKRRIRLNFNQLVKNIDILLGETCPYWFIENYMWFYEKKILKDLCAKHGMPIELAEKIFYAPSEVEDNVHVQNGIFEVTLYQNYIYLNKKYNYQFICVDDEMKKYLPQNEIDLYLDKFYSYWKGSCGIMEHVCMFLTKKNIRGLISMFKNLKIFIFRCEITNAQNYLLQRRFVSSVAPVILASSQNHVFGINACPKNRFRLLVASNKYSKKLRDSWEVIKNTEITFQGTFVWIKTLFKVIKYFIRICCVFLRNIHIIYGK